jgi:hypothetical protein
MRGRPLWARIAIGALVLGATPLASAMECAGRVAYLALGQGGTVQVSIGFGVWYLCDLGSARNGFTLEACRGAYASLLAAHAQGRRVSIFFNVPEPTACSAFGSWIDTNPSPYHLRFHED